MRDTLKLWEDIKTGKYDVFMSETTFEELRRCHAKKLSVLVDYVNLIDYTLLKNSEEVENVANQIIQLGILNPKNFDDCVHIAHAVVNACDYLVSWNFKHMVNVKTIKGVRAIAILSGYGNIDIVAPTMLLESEE
jgi:predicted nucleic acid-binding protein